MKPGTTAAATATKTKTTEVISWQWPCGAACKMVRQVTTSCPHGLQGTPPAHHHHPHHPQEGSKKALATTEQSNAAGRSITLTPAAAVVPELWVAEPNVMVQQLRELEPLLGDKAVALRVHAAGGVHGGDREEQEGQRQDGEGLVPHSPGQRQGSRSSSWPRTPSPAN